MKVEKDYVVSIHYTLKDDNKNTIDSSANGDPLVYIQGMGHIIPGLESALDGKAKGEQFSVTIQPEQAYGPRSEEKIQNVPKTEFQDAETITEGMQLKADTDHGPLIFTVIEVRENDIVLDGNHPLAGTTLNFEVEVHDVRKATAEELSHGHVHGEGGHHH